MYVRIFLNKAYPNDRDQSKRYYIDLKNVRLLRHMVYIYGYDDIGDALQNRFFWKYMGRYTENEEIIWIYDNWSEGMIKNKIEYID